MYELVTLSPSSKAAIVLGASKFRKSPGLNRAGFFASATDFVSYLLDGRLFALPNNNLLNLFDSELSPGDQLEKISDFLDEYLHRAADKISDIILYYVGHGGFVGINKEYCLTIASTKEGSEGSSGIRAGDLSSSLLDHARRARKYLILDCCFAASAFSLFQGSGLSDVISSQTLEPLPLSGTALLCSSGSRQVSLAPNDHTHTMFSGALMQVLRNGESSGQAAFSLEEVGRRVKDFLRNKYPEEWIRPEVHSPDMHEGDIADIPIFPNPKFDPERATISMTDRVSNLESLLAARTEELRLANSNMERSFDITVEALGDALDSRGVEDEGHSKRVTAFTIAIARGLGVRREDITVIARGAFLHDIGKMAIPDAILRKPAALTPEESTKMREHCSWGYRMLAKIPFLRDAAEIVYSHHERYDGSGYPRGLKGKEIPLGARIFAVADTLEAVMSNRSYRPSRPLSLDSAREEIQRCSGTQFDPAVVKAFVDMPSDVWGDLSKEIDSQIRRSKISPKRRVPIPSAYLAKKGRVIGS